MKSNFLMVSQLTHNIIYQRLAIIIIIIVVIMAVGGSSIDRTVICFCFKHLLMTLCLAPMPFVIRVTNCDRLRRRLASYKPDQLKNAAFKKTP